MCATDAMTRDQLVKKVHHLEAEVQWLKEQFRLAQRRQFGVSSEQTSAEQQAEKALPKSAVGQAIRYCLNQWEKLTAFLLDGRLELDNNRGERSIKPFVIGRKNWLFANTPKGATASAIIYSLVETAKENALNPQAYLQYLFEHLPQIDRTDSATLDALLPWSPTLPDTCHVPPRPTA